MVMLSTVCQNSIHTLTDLKENAKISAKYCFSNSPFLNDFQ